MDGSGGGFGAELMLLGGVEAARSGEEAEDVDILLLLLLLLLLLFDEVAIRWLLADGGAWAA
jgi:hypothetical protein